jgi:Polysaccharide deacetylase
MFTLVVLLTTLTRALPAFSLSFSIPRITGGDEWNPSSSFTNGDLQTRPEFSSAGSNSLPPVYTQCTTPDTVSLTFDDGPYDFMYNVSNTLTANDAKGTFHLLDSGARDVVDVRNASSEDLILSLPRFI